MSEIYGADLEGLDRLSALFEAKADRLDAIRNQSLNAVGELNRLWQGVDAADFTHRWTNSHSQALTRAAGDLRDASETIKQNRAHQERTSAVDGGGSGGGGGGGGGGGLFGGLGSAWGSATGFVSDAWDSTTDFASDAWDASGDFASDVWDGAGGLASWAWDGASGFGSGVWDFTSGVAADAWGPISDFGSEIGHRFWELGEYGWAQGTRRLTNPVQTFIDDMTLTGPFETLVATVAILGLGGEFEAGIGDGQFEGIHGTSIAPDGAITLGHTVIFDNPMPSDNLIEHEQQHVYDVESIGGAPFYATYIGNWIGNIVAGQDPAPGGEAYENIWWEQRADNVQHGPDVPGHLTFDFDPRSWFD